MSTPCQDRPVVACRRKRAGEFGRGRRDDLGSPNRFDVYHGMADNRIGVARLNMPDFLPPGGGADPPEAKM